MEYEFTRYLSAKKPLDDRSLNQYVRQKLASALPSGPLDVLEVGAGTGTMIDRMLEWDMFPEGGHYTAIDVDIDNITAARRRLHSQALPLALEFEAADVHDFARRARGCRTWDLLIAHAFLDLIDVPRLLPQLFALLRPGGLFYFTLNFDGLTILEPPADPDIDEKVIAVYHRTMDERRAGGRPAGGSRAGRELLRQVPAAGGRILAAGSSDWIVLPHEGRYPGDEAYFLYHILHFFENSLAGRPELNPSRFAGWLARRRLQIEAGELLLIAHQIDICGRVAGR